MTPGSVIGMVGRLFNSTLSV